MKHAYRYGLAHEWGETNPGAKLTNAQVEEIRLLYATGKHLQKDLAERFNVSFQAISKIVRGERRSKQSGPVDESDHRFPSERDPKTGRFVGKKAAGCLLDSQRMSEVLGARLYDGL